MVENKSREGKGFRKLLVWQRAHELSLLVYQMTSDFPKPEQFGLTSQLRRAAVSVPANIAEGFALGTDPQFLRHLRIAQGSLAEVEYYFILCDDLHYVQKDQIEKAESLRAETGYLLSKLIASIESRSRKR
jgi:four helix bundle protein